MATEADGRTGGRADALLAGGLLAGVALLLSASPPVRRSDIHSEYVKFLSGRDTITAYLAYPERRDPAPAVIVIHEIFGMSDFIRQTAEQLAENDARIDAGLPDAAAGMKAAGKDYPYAIYPGVGHGFLRSRDVPAVADSAWRNVIRFFRENLEGR